MPGRGSCPAGRSCRDPGRAAGRSSAGTGSCCTHPAGPAGGNPGRTGKTAEPRSPGRTGRTGSGSPDRTRTGCRSSGHTSSGRRNPERTNPDRTRTDCRRTGRTRRSAGKKQAAEQHRGSARSPGGFRSYSQTSVILSFTVAVNSFISLNALRSAKPYPQLYKQAAL